MNCVHTAASTVTRWRAIAATSARASNCGSSTVGAPSSAGVKCAVQRPKPNGAGSADKKTSRSLSSAASTASRWKWIQRAWSCMTHLGRPVVPEVELSSQRSVDAEASLGERAPARRRCRRAIGSPGSKSPTRDEVMAQRRALGAKPRDERARVELAVARAREQRAQRPSARSGGGPPPRPARGPIPIATRPAFSVATNATCTPGPSGSSTATRSPGASPARTKAEASASDRSA